MTVRDKLFFWGVLFFIVVGIMSYVYDKNVCDPRWDEIEKKLDYIKSENSIVKIKLFKENDLYQTNLVADTVLMTDSSEIETIRDLINRRTTGTWNRPIAKWSVKMRLYLSNSETFDIEVSKISNDKESKMTHIYFGSGHCSDNLPETSLILGDHLETSTQFTGQLF